MNDQTWFHARCLNPACRSHHTVASRDTHLARSEWVGEHRLATGHNVQMWQGTYDDRNNIPGEGPT